MHQFSFEDASYYTRYTRKQKLLSTMVQVITWADMVAVIEPHYSKGDKGRLPIPLETMLYI